ncbi:zinc finger BED domain-containing protein 4-like, partial [Aphis craccivora]
MCVIKFHLDNKGLCLKYMCPILQTAVQLNINLCTSNIWNNFTIFYQSHYIAKCDICLKKYSFKSTLTNLKKHLCNCHGIDLSNSPKVSTYIIKINKQIDDPAPDQSPIPSSLNTFSLNQVSNSTVCKHKQTSVSNYLFVKDFQPFKVVEDLGFKEFVKALNPSYELPNRNTISKVHILAMYEKCLGEMKELVSTIESACLTTDCWTSRNNESFMAITVHFINSEFVILLSWNLNDKITFAVSDNARNIKNALNLLSLKHMGCFAHTLNLIVQSVLVLEDGLIDRVKSIVSHFRKSTVANNVFKTYQINNGIKEPKKLIQDIQTRWNSTYYMINRFVEMETSIRGTLGLLDNAPDNLKSEDWIIFQDLIKILKPLEEATKAISGQKYMTASLVIFIVQGLYKVCNNLLKMNLSPRALLIAKQLISTMDARDDPRFKHLPFSNVSSVKSEVIENLTHIIRKKEQTSDQLDINIQQTSLPISDLSIWSEIDNNVSKFTPLGTAKSRAIVEIQRYMDDVVIARNQDPFKWWKDQRYNYPNLSILAKNILCHLGTSVPCERIFSSAGLVLNDCRCRLKSDKMTYIVSSQT